MYKNPGIFLLKLSEFFSINLFQFCWNLLATDPWDIKFIEEKTFKLQLTSQTLHIMWKIFCSWLYSKYTYAHTSLEASLRKMKCLKHSANAGDSQKPIQKFWDGSQLFWIGDLGDYPLVFNFWVPKSIFWGSIIIIDIRMGSLRAPASKFFGLELSCWS